MSLANLSIDVTVNTGQAQRGLRDVGATAQEQFMRSGAAVDDFRTEILAASSALDRAARSMGAGMDRAATEIEASSARSAQAVTEIQQAANDVNFEGMTEKVSAAFGMAFGAGYAATQTWLEKTEEFVVAKAKMMAVGLAITAVSAAAGAVYAAYKVISGTLGFVKGLFTGESYKSDSIDRLIARNKEQIDKQTAAKKESADMDFRVTKSMRENGAELDRLGIKYKDQDGRLLSHREYLKNVKKGLEEYAAGYDRVQAAQAIGVGSLEEVEAALKDNDAEQAKVNDRMDKYLLRIGPQGQAEIKRYEKAIQEFNQEMQYTSDGFSHAIADSIMPALTDLAEFFKEGWPVAVRVFRGSLATVTTLFYGLKMAADIAMEGVKLAVNVAGEAIVGVASATVKAFKGDFSGAADDMRKAWENSGDAVSKALEQVAEDAEKNRDRMALAFGLDGLDPSAMAPDNDKGKKTWSPAPDKQSVIKSPFQAYLDDLDRMAAKVEQNEYASMRLRVEQLAQKEGITDLADAYAKIDRVQRGDSAKVVEEHSQALYEAANAYEFETSLIGKNVLEQDKLIAAYREQQQVISIIQAAKRTSRPMDQMAIDDLNEMAKAVIKQSQAQIEARDKLQRSFDIGVSTTLSNYVRDATDAAANVANIISGSFMRMEDALLSFVKTGKLNLKDLFTFMADEYLRQQIRMAIAGGISSLSGGIANFIGDLGYVFGKGSFALANGIDYVPYNGYPATLHEGEKVLTRQDAQAFRAGNQDTGASGPNIVIHVASGITHGEFASMIPQLAQQIKNQVQWSSRRPGYVGGL